MNSLAGHLSSSGGASSGSSIDLSGAHFGASNVHHQANSWDHGDAQGSILWKALGSAIVDQSPNVALAGADDASHAPNGSDHGHGAFAAHAHSQAFHFEHMWS